MIPHYSLLGKSSYLEFYLDILNDLTEDFPKDNELFTYSVKPLLEVENSEPVTYDFYFSGLRKVVLEELLNKLALIDASTINRDLNDLNRHSNQYGVLIEVINSVNNNWSEDTKYNANLL